MARLARRAIATCPQCGLIVVDMPHSSLPSAVGSSAADERGSEPERVSDELKRWLSAEGDTILGSLIELFGEKSFAILFVLLLGVSALPLPTGGATHVFEIIAVLLAFQLIADRDEIWQPQRWRKLQLAGEKQQRLITALMKLIRRLERISRPRLRFLFDHRQPPTGSRPGTHRVEDALARPAPLDRPRVAGLHTRRRRPLPFARLRVRPAAAAHPPVARLDRPRLLAGRVVEIRLDRGWRPAQALGDLRDRQALGVTVVAG